MDDAPLPIPPSEPVPEQPLAVQADVTAAPQPSPAAETAVQAPVVRVQKQPSSIPPAPPVKKERPASTPPMIITDRKPAAPAKPRSAPVAAAVGTLVVAVQPWAEVWIDGRKRGISPPLFKLQLPPGSYKIELRNPDLPGYSQNVQISAGQSVTLRHSFQ
ncbi:PEGA domain-containing protein [Pseudomonas nicosulfuronedens]